MMEFTWQKKIPDITKRKKLSKFDRDEINRKLMEIRT